MNNWNILGATVETTLSANAVTRSVTKGSLLAFMWWTGTISGSPLGFSPADNMGNKWIHDPRTRVIGSAGCGMAVYYAIAKSSGTLTVTVRDSGGTDSGCIIEINRGFDPVSPFHKSGGNVGATTSGEADGDTSGSVTTERNGCLILSCLFYTNLQSAAQIWDEGTGFTDLGAASNDPDALAGSGIIWHWQYAYQAAHGEINPTWDSLDGGGQLYDGWTIALKPPIAPSSTKKRTLPDVLDHEEDEGRFNELDIRNWYRAPSGLVVPCR